METNSDKNKVFPTSGVTLSTLKLFEIDIVLHTNSGTLCCLKCMQSQEQAIFFSSSATKCVQEKTW